MGRMIRGSNPGMNKRSLSSPEHPEWFWNPPFLLFNTRGNSIPKEKRLRREGDLPLTFSVKNDWSYTSERDNFTIFT
jgi:hypothetical protein